MFCYLRAQIYDVHLVLMMHFGSDFFQNFWANFGNFLSFFVPIFKFCFVIFVRNFPKFRISSRPGKKCKTKSKSLAMISFPLLHGNVLVYVLMETCHSTVDEKVCTIRVLDFRVQSTYEQWDSSRDWILEEPHA